MGPRQSNSIADAEDLCRTPARNLRYRNSRALPFVTASCRKMPPKMSRYAITRQYLTEEDLEALLKRLFGEGDYRISVGRELSALPWPR